MDKLDLNRVSIIKVNAIIDQKHGGRLDKDSVALYGGRGIAGLQFEPVAQEIQPFKVNLEILNEGLAVYFRNVTENHILLFRFDEFKSIEIRKPSDILINKSNSLFKLLRKWNVPHHYARIFLLDREIVALNEGQLTMHFHKYDSIVLGITKRNYHTIEDFIFKIGGFVRVSALMEDFEYV